MSTSALDGKVAIVTGAGIETGRDVDHYQKTVSLLGRFGAPDEVANAHLWLCSDASSAMTGTVLHLDAGYVQTPPYEVRFLQ